VLAVVATSAAAFQFGSALPYSWLVAALLPVAFGGGVALAIAVLAARSERQLARLDWVLLALGCVSLLTMLAGTLFTHPGYTSDEAAFEQAAAHLLLHGHDPYGANLSWAFTQFRVTPRYQTFLLNGGEATTLGYPALPTLVAAVGNLLVGGTEAQPITYVAVLLVTLVLLFKLLERRLRPLAVLAIVPLPMMFLSATGGLTEIILAPLLVFVAYRWSSTGRGGRLTRLQKWQAIAFGLALAAQQEAWILAPFLVLAILLMRRSEIGFAQAAKVAGRYVAIALLAFFVLNLTFIAWGPKAWLLGVTTPLRQKALPLGQGLIDWTVYLGHGGGMLSAYSYAALALLLGLLALYVIEFPRLARALFALPVAPLFVSTRPLFPYFIALVGAMVVSVTSPDQDEFHTLQPLWRPPRRWHRPAAGAVCLVPTFVLIVLALAVPAPLTVRLLATMGLSGPGSNIYRLRLSVHNRSGHALTPRFVTNAVGSSSAFWHQTSGPRSLAAGATRVYVLTAPDTTAMFGANEAVALGAATSSPATFSSGGRISAHGYIADLEPQQVDHVLAPGQSVTFTVQLRTVAGAAVHQAGVPVALTQSVAGPQGNAEVLADINHQGPGMHTVQGRTNREGQATFRVTGNHEATQPVLFQAYVTGPGQPPYGRSGTVSVLWGH